MPCPRSMSKPRPWHVTRRVAARPRRPLRDRRGAFPPLRRAGPHRRRLRALSRRVRPSPARGRRVTPDRGASEISRQELLIYSIARLLEGCRSVAVGASSPIPGAGALPRSSRAATGAPARRMFLTILERVANTCPRRGRIVRHGRPRPRRRLLPGRRPDRRRGQHQPGRRRRRLSADGGALARLLRLGLPLFPRAARDLFGEEHTRRSWCPRSISFQRPVRVPTVCIVPAGRSGFDQPVLVLVRQDTPALHPGDGPSRPQPRRSTRPYRLRFRHRAARPKRWYRTRPRSRPSADRSRARSATPIHASLPKSFPTPPEPTAP